MLFPRLMTAMVTPYNDDLTVNFQKAGDLAEYLCDNGSDGIVVCGTTGESPVLTIEEKLQLFATVKQRLGSRASVWAGAGSNNTQLSADLSREAENTGVDGIMLVTPYYNKPSQEGLYQNFKKIAGEVSLPVMLYNVPGRTSCNLLPATVARLAEIDNIAAIKEASGNMDQVSELRNLVGDKMTIYSGDDSLTLPMLALGAHGVVSIASHLVGKEIKQMIDAFVSGKVEEAAQIHGNLFAMFKGLFVTTNPIPLKEALNIIGMEVGGFRLPLCGAGEKDLVFIKKLLDSYNMLPK
ncbi:MAG: 4-hydroxy-tetrahydrodipicolinate synthase [Syntrophomonas sp.]